MVNSISVTGTGRVGGNPDILFVDVGVSVRRSTIHEATSDAARIAGDVIQAVEEHGVGLRDIRTSHYSIRPDYDRRGEVQTLRGYRATYTVSLKIRDVDGAGAVIDSATAAAGSAAVVNAIRFEVEESEELVKAAREAAWADAEAKARHLALLARLDLGKAISITENIDRPVPVLARAMVETGEVTPIEAGEQAVSVSLSVEFAVR